MTESHPKEGEAKGALVSPFTNILNYAIKKETMLESSILVTIEEIKEEICYIYK